MLPHVGTSAHQRICIAVCTRNRAKPLEQALTSLAAQIPIPGVSTELLVVDNGSDDATSATLDAFGRSHPHTKLRSVVEPQVGFASVRNRAIEETDAEWIAFFDDDQRAPTDWLSALWSVAAEHPADCVGGTVQLELPENGFVPGPRCRALLGEQPVTDRHRFGKAFQPGTGNLLIRRDRLIMAGKFDTRRPGRGEDTRLFARLQEQGCECWFAPRATVRHVIPAERNLPAAYRALAKASADAGDLSIQRWRGWLPLVVLARFCRVCAWEMPKLAAASLFGSEGARVDAECAVIMEWWRGVSELRQSLVAVTKGVART